MSTHCTHRCINNTPVMASWHVANPLRMRIGNTLIFPANLVSRYLARAARRRPCIRMLALWRTCRYSQRSSKKRMNGSWCGPGELAGGWTYPLNASWCGPGELAGGWTYPLKTATYWREEQGYWEDMAGHMEGGWGTIKARVDMTKNDKMAKIAQYEVDPLPLQRVYGCLGHHWGHGRVGQYL